MHPRGLGLGQKDFAPGRADLPKRDWLRYADIGEISWNYFNSSGTTHPIATKKPNDRGFYDLLGNVAEYLAQPSDADSARVIGGNAQTAPDAIKDIPVSDFDPKQRNRMVGFRIVVSDK